MSGPTWTQEEFRRYFEVDSNMISSLDEYNIDYAFDRLLLKLDYARADKLNNVIEAVSKAHKLFNELCN